MSSADGLASRECLFWAPSPKRSKIELTSPASRWLMFDPGSTAARAVCSPAAKQNDNGDDYERADRRQLVWLTPRRRRRRDLFAISRSLTPTCKNDSASCSDRPSEQWLSRLLLRDSTRRDPAWPSRAAPPSWWRPLALAVRPSVRTHLTHGQRAID